MFHVGQHVVCVHPNPETTRANWCPQYNGVYRVRGYYHGPEHDQLYLEEYVHHETHPDGCEIGWHVDGFRPLQDSRLDIFRQLLVTPPKQGVDA